MIHVAILFLISQSQELLVQKNGKEIQSRIQAQGVC